MTEKQETIARALEIAISLTDAKDTWIRTDQDNNVLMNESLLRTLETVLRIFNGKNLINIVNNGSAAGWIYPDKRLNSL